VSSSVPPSSRVQASSSRTEASGTSKACPIRGDYSGLWTDAKPVAPPSRSSLAAHLAVDVGDGA